MSGRKFELFYFNFMGRAEAIRLIFAQAGVEYKDTRFKDLEDWANNYKKRSPFGVAPFLEVDGVKIGGASEIARFLGEEFGLAGKTTLDNTRIASIVNHLGDMLSEVGKINQAKDEDKEKCTAEFVEKSPKWLAVFEGIITPSGWLFGDNITWADIYAYHFLSLLQDKMIPNLLKDYPKMTAWLSNVASQPNIAKWIEERPKTQ